MRSKIYPCDNSREWWDWEAGYSEQEQLDRYEIIWREDAERRMANDNAACGWVPQQNEMEG